jgi:hypothetical protein
MLYTRLYRVKPDHVDRLRAWMRDVAGREEEARQSYAQEGTTHVQAQLLLCGPDPVLVFIAEVGDERKARAANVASELAIDREHREIMHEVVEGRAEAEVIYEWPCGEGTP